VILAVGVTDAVGVFVGVSVCVGVIVDVGVLVGVNVGVGVTLCVGVGVGVGAIKTTSTGHVHAEVLTLVIPQLLITSPGSKKELKLNCIVWSPKGNVLTPL